MSLPKTLQRKVPDTNDKWFGVTYKDYVVRSFVKLIESVCIIRICLKI